VTEPTGITDEMVRSAPTFRDIADEFRQFRGKAVFAAHRAQFDYGLIREEFRRIEADFHLPKFCNVVGARRHFTGLPSYGLANLCREFDIPLDSHHRAVCDARATAQILACINEKRADPGGELNDLIECPLSISLNFSDEHKLLELINRLF